MVYNFADYELDEQLYQLRYDGEIVALEPQVYRLLAYVLRQAQAVAEAERRIP